MDLDVFYGAYRADGHRRPAYEPSMMVALLLYGWSPGVRSSRAIERASIEDVAARVIAAQRRPDHATIARFIECHEQSLAHLFGEVLALCADAGLATVGVIAIDGTKVSATANRDRTLAYEQIAPGDRRGSNPLAMRGQDDVDAQSQLPEPLRHHGIARQPHAIAAGMRGVAARQDRQGVWSLLEMMLGDRDVWSPG